MNPIFEKQQFHQVPKLQSPKKQQSTNQQEVFVFNPISTQKLKDIYHEIKKKQLETSHQTMFPTNFCQVHSKQLNLYLFQIEVQDLFKKWKQSFYYHWRRIIKSLYQLVQLKQSLQQKFPNQSLIFSFPVPEQNEINHQIAQSILHLFCAFLNSISQSPSITKQKQFLLFIQNWVSEDKKKITTYFQRNLKKKAGGRHTESSLIRIINNFYLWRQKFFTVATEGVYYTDSDESFSIKQMLPFNQSFSLLHGEIKTGYTYGLILNSSHRVLQVDAENVVNFLLFIHCIKRAIHQSQQDHNHNRYNSFAKVRQNCSGTFYIDGKDYFENLYYELIKAKNQVFITGWFLTPCMYLVQKYQDLTYRIDKVLQKLAFKGVKIYIIVYNAPRIAIDINPEFTETYLTSLHENIKVLRHPNYMFIPFLWSHHQKMVIIDYKVAFMGGLDIGYGRMDDNNHRLSDQQQKSWKGIDYCNYRISDLTQIHIHTVCSIDRQCQPRMPWHDIGIKIIGKSVSDLCRHFVQYWNYANCQLYLTERQLMLFTGIHEEELQANGLEDNATKGHSALIVKTQDKETNQSSLKSRIVDEGKRFNNVSEMTIVQDKMLNQVRDQGEITKNSRLIIMPPSISKSNNFLLNGDEVMKVNNNHHPRRSFMKTTYKNKNHFLSLIDSAPIHQFYRQQPQLKKLRSSGSITVHEDQKQKEIQYYLNFLKQEKQNHKFEQEKEQIRRSQMKKQQQHIPALSLKEDTQGSKQNLNLPPTTLNKQQRFIITNKHLQTHQILRSASLWSLGLKQGKQQKSILEAYLSLIQNAKHFIYIQNQFFISVENQVSDKIVERILQAYQKKQIFKVMIVLPFLPGFPGQIESDSSAVFRIQLDLIYKTICRTQNSLLHRLSQQINNLQDYLAIYCLRTHGTINGIPNTEIVYVHSKLIIIDDSIIVLGSANINDRSLMGDRDSEIGIVVQDQEEIVIGGEEGQENGLVRIEVRKAAHELRKQLYMQHFGLRQQQAQHFFNFKVWDQIQFTAQRNQKIYKKLFGCYPDDSIKRFSDIEKLKDQAQPQRYEELKLLIKGYACPFQTEFLLDQNLQLHSGQKEYYIPFINFT